MEVWSGFLLDLIIINFIQLQYGFTISARDLCRSIRWSSPIESPAPFSGYRNAARVTKPSHDLRRKNQRKRRLYRPQFFGENDEDVMLHVL